MKAIDFINIITINIIGIVCLLFTLYLYLVIIKNIYNTISKINNTLSKIENNMEDIEKYVKG